MRNSKFPWGMGDFMQISENFSYIHRVDLLDFRCLWYQHECYDQCTLDGNTVGN